MKKYILLAGVALASTIAFNATAATSTEANPSTELSAAVEILTPTDLGSQPLDFGQMIMGLGSGRVIEVTPNGEYGENTDATVRGGVSAGGIFVYGGVASAAFTGWKNDIRKTILEKQLHRDNYLSTDEDKAAIDAEIASLESEIASGVPSNGFVSEVESLLQLSSNTIVLTDVVNGSGRCGEVTLIPGTSRFTANDLFFKSYGGKFVMDEDFTPVDGAAVCEGSVSATLILPE